MPLKPTTLPRRAFAIDTVVVLQEVIVMIAGERFYAAAWIACPAPVQDCPPRAAQTTPGGDTGVKSSITLPSATSS